MDKLLVIIILVIGILALVPLFVMLLWNWVMVDVFSLPEVSYLQALGLFLLANMLLKTYIPNNSK